MARNFGHNLDGLVAVNVDKESRYRSTVNVLNRPSDEGIELTGHHEILLPLLHAAVACSRPAGAVPPSVQSGMMTQHGTTEASDAELKTDACSEGPSSLDESSCLVSVTQCLCGEDRWRPSMSTRELIELVQNLGQPRVLVVGDLMLDRYVWGDAERISQEAPVILLHADRREERLGGASSVATMLRALGARVSLAGVVGDDADGGRIRQLLLDHGIDDEAVLVDAGRPSTVKERYIGRAQHRHPQQMIRVDYEVRKPLAPAVERELVQVVGRQMRHTDVVLISDYDKGVCTPGLLATVIAAARACGVKRAWPTPCAAATTASTTAAPPSRPTAWKPAWPSAACWPTPPRPWKRRPSCASGSTWRRPSSRSTRKAWRWPTPTAAARSSRPGRGRSTTSPARATW